MKSIRITFRLSPYQLARGLQTIRQLEPTYKLMSTNDLVKTIYHDYLAKMSLNKNDTIPSALLAEILRFTNKPNSKSLNLDELINLQEPKQTEHQEPISEPEQEEKTIIHHDFNDPENDPDLTDEILAEIKKQSKASSFNDPNETESDIQSVTDFSPPTDWEK